MGYKYKYQNEKPWGSCKECLNKKECKTWNENGIEYIGFSSIEIALMCRYYKRDE